MSYSHGDRTGTARLPDWLRRPVAHGARYVSTDSLVTGLGLRTVCAEARCPNRGECYSDGTATFLVLGDVCTRRCGFCAVAEGTPAPPDSGEPRRVAEAVARLGLSHAVVTMVTRDDLPDGGAAHVAAVVAAIRGSSPEARIEVLVGDFGGAPESLRRVLDAGPDVFNHNLETVPRLYGRVRPGADYRRSLDVLGQAAAYGRAALKSGLMLGLGETRDEVLAVIGDMREAGVSVLTLGQYLRPGAASLPVERFWEPEEFAEMAREAYGRGFAAVASGPTVRSSYRAGELAGGA